MHEGSPSLELYGIECSARSHSSNSSLSVLIPLTKPFENTSSMVEIMGHVASIVSM